MITVEIEKAPPYLALSYTWGCKEQSRTILVNGREVPVTANLGEAIDVIFTFARSQEMMLWADSICIDQTNLHERSQQVQIMNTIYRSAEKVVIWLGPVAYDINLAFDIMREWKKMVDVLSKECEISNEEALFKISSEDQVFLELSNSDQQRVFEAIDYIFHRPWWSRAWIVQEGTVTHASRTAFFCGNKQISWNAFYIGFSVLNNAKPHQEWYIRRDFRYAVAKELILFRRQRELGDNIKLQRVLHLMRGFECEDPRDKVYAARGMAMDVLEGDIIPDYRKACSEVYLDVVRFLMSETNSPTLDFLGFVFNLTAEISDRQPELVLPSWVPNWTTPVLYEPLYKDLSDGWDGKQVKAYNASGKRPGTCSIIGQSLHVQGSVLDQIIDLSDRHWKRPDFTRELNRLRSWATERIPDELHFNGETNMEAFNHTLTTDIGRVYERDMCILKRGKAFEWDLFDKEKEKLTTAERRKQGEMLFDISTITNGRRIFRTKRGFMGLGPNAAEIGDKVCVLLGGQVLYVLREGYESSNFKFVGECYVHGMMDGQACEDKEFSIRDIELV